MKKFYPHNAIRFFAGYGIFLLLVVLPLVLGFVAADLAVPGEEMYLFLLCAGISLCGCILIHIGFWEKCFSHLELSEKEIRWKCPLRRDRVIPTEKCVEIGVYMENEDNGISVELIYFSDHPNPKQNMGKNGVIKASNHFIKFWYSEDLYKYLIRTYSSKQTSCLLAYRQRRKRW